MPMGKFRAANLAGFDEPAEGGKWPAKTVVGVGFGVVAFRWRAECPFHSRVVIEEGKENGDAFDDGGPQLGLDAPPVVVEPALDGLQLFLAIGIDLVEPGFAKAVEVNGLALQESPRSRSVLGAKHFKGSIQGKIEEFQVRDMSAAVRGGNKQEIAFFETPLGILDLLLQNIRRDRALVDVEKGHVVISDLVQEDDELDEVGVGLLPERFLALAEEVV